VHIATCEMERAEKSTHRGGKVFCAPVHPSGQLWHHEREAVELELFIFIIEIDSGLIYGCDLKENKARATGEGDGGRKGRVGVGKRGGGQRREV
jgi:hypothetical protein